MARRRGILAPMTQNRDDLTSALDHLRETVRRLRTMGWSGDDLDHVVTRRLSPAHARCVRDGALPRDGAQALRVTVEALSLLLVLPDVAPVRKVQPAAGGGGIDHRVLTRVRALLRKAESTDFPAEAEALTAKAQELIARHAVDALLLDVEDDGQPRRCSHRRRGRWRGRGPASTPSGGRARSPSAARS